MASLTKKVRTIRKNKARKAGAARKKRLARDGTTPAFAVHQAKSDS